MITLLEFINKGHIKSEAVTIYYPKIETEKDNEGCILKATITGYKQFNVQKKPICIYYDKYCRNRLHIADISDLMVRIGVLYGDFEDFSEKDIVAWFDTYKEAAEYIINGRHTSFADNHDWLQNAADGKEDDGTDSLPIPGENYKDCTGDIEEGLEYWCNEVINKIH